MLSLLFLFFFFFNDTATTEIYTLSLHDALPICTSGRFPAVTTCPPAGLSRWRRSEEHTSELQSRGHLVCRLLLEKKKEPLLRGGTSVDVYRAVVDNRDQLSFLPRALPEASFFFNDTATTEIYTLSLHDALPI